MSDNVLMKTFARIMIPCLALAAACGGSVDTTPSSDATKPAGHPSGVKPAPPADGEQAAATPPAPTGTTTPSPTSLPPQPTGPYTGLVATTDVSILYPLPSAGASTDFVRPDETGAFGALLDEATATTVLGGRTYLDSDRGPSGYPQLALVSVRLDPCSARGVAQGACRSEVRAVFQPILEEAAGASATDGALHVSYDVPDAEVMAMLEDILALKQANGGLGLQELAPHPILAAQGLGGPFAQGLRAILLDHVGAARIGRVTMFDHQNPEGHRWTFTAFDRTAPGAATFAPIALPGVGTATSQTIVGSDATTPLAQSSASVSPALAEPDPVGRLVGDGAAGGGDMQSVLDAALRVEDPTAHDIRSTSCANCHLAEPAVRFGTSVDGLDPAAAFTSTRSLAYVNDAPSATNLHAFGYLGRSVAIMQRTANESAVVAATMEVRLGVATK